MFNHGNLLGKGGLGKNIAAPGSGVRKHAGCHHHHTVRFRIITPHQIRPHFAHGIWRGGMKRRVFFNGKQFLGHPPKHFGRCANMNDRLRCIGAGGFQNAHGALHVGVKSIQRRFKLVRGKLCAAK